MSSGSLRGVGRFADPRSFQGILFALDQRFQIQAGAVAIFEGVGAQAIERRLRDGAKPVDVCLLCVREAAAILGKDGLNARFHFGVTFGRKLRQVCSLLLGKGGVAGWLGKALATVCGRYIRMFIQWS
jgi:hypothetical protein